MTRRAVRPEQLPERTARFLLPFEGRDVKIEHSLKPAEGKA